MKGIAKNIFAGVGVIATAITALMIISTLDTGGFTSVESRR